MPQTPRQMPLRRKGSRMNKIQKRQFADYRQAAGLLLDKNLEWSADMEAIRVDLGIYIMRMADRGDFADFNILAIVQRLIADENDMSI